MAREKTKSLSRPYPRLPLSDAERIPLAIKAKNGGNPWLEDEVKRATSGAGVSVDDPSIKKNPFFYLNSSAKAFKLIESVKPAEKPKTKSEEKVLKLTDLGRELAYPSSEQEQQSARQKAFLSVDIFRQVYQHYRESGVPEREFASNTLHKDYGLDPAVHDEFLDLYNANAAFCKIGNSATGAIGAGHVEAAISDGGHKETKSGRFIGSHLRVVAEPEQDKGLTAFVALPFSERSDTYPKGFFDEALKQLIGPAAASAGFTVVTAEQHGSDIIQATIVNSLIDADLVIADLTEHNPNVLFELGVRMALDKPVCLVRAEGTRSVFDIDAMMRVYSYNGNLWKSSVAGDLVNLEAHVRGTWEQRDSDQTYMKILRQKKMGA